MINLKNNYIFGMSDYRLAIKSRILIYKTMIRSLMEYGLNLCNFNKSLMKKLESIQPHFISRILSVLINTNKKLLLFSLNIEDMGF